MRTNWNVAIRWIMTMGLLVSLTSGGFAEEKGGVTPTPEVTPTPCITPVPPTNCAYLCTWLNDVERNCPGLIKWPPELNPDFVGGITFCCGGHAYGCILDSMQGPPPGGCGVECMQLHENYHAEHTQCESGVYFPRMPDS